MGGHRVPSETTRLIFITPLTRRKVGKEKLGYPVCSGWFEEFCIWAGDFLRGEWGDIDQDGTFIQSKEFNLDPICNYHGDDSYVYLSREYWVAMVAMFGYIIEEEGKVQTDPDAVEPKDTDGAMNTRSRNGEWSDADLIESIAEVKGIVI